jgi:hypothetical protein
VKLYGIREIADELGERPNTVSVWYHRGKLPVPSFILAMGPVWTERRIRPFIEAQQKEK